MRLNNRRAHSLAGRFQVSGVNSTPPELFQAAAGLRERVAATHTGVRLMMVCGSVVVGKRVKRSRR
jgi:hypothetical protein